MCMMFFAYMYKEACGLTVPVDNHSSFNINEMGEAFACDGCDMYTIVNFKTAINNGFWIVCTVPSNQSGQAGNTDVKMK